jgi:cobaltochelatase CobT
VTSVAASEAALVTRRQQDIERLCLAAIRALTGEPELHFRGRQLHRGRRLVPMRAPHLHPSPADDDFGSFRGAADGIALRLSQSDAELHDRLCPTDTVERLIFEMLEQFRVEALAPSGMPGMVRNLRHRHEQWSRTFHQSGLTDTTTGLLLYTIAQACRSWITAQPVVAETEEIIEPCRAGLAPVLGHMFAGLRRHRHHQAEFAEHALALARAVAEQLRDLRAEASVGDESGEDLSSARFSLLVGLDQDAEGHDTATAAGGGSRPVGSANEYRVFTTSYDQQHAVERLVRPALLAEYREHLDRRIAELGVNVGRLARELTALFAEPARDGWDYGQDEGQIDGRRLAQLVSSPGQRVLFRAERVEPVADTLVTFLIDCSGSMTKHAELVAVLVDVFARALELAGVGCEILGFTTGAWNGGRARRDWVRAGRPEGPGRLNEQCHLVFKDADTPWRRARPRIAALLKTELFREGIDGEAVAWACRRMDSREEPRRVLVVISDGSPCDSATSLANGPRYLDEHLTQTVLELEQKGTVEISGLGLGLDLSAYFRHCRALDPVGSAGSGIFREVLELLARR